MIITLMYLHKQLQDEKRSIYTEQLSAYDEWQHSTTSMI